jgi:ectoine hydroxylase-related dioxygenase (phytanoyl-CoA dioxygenase family)
MPAPPTPTQASLSVEMLMQSNFWQQFAPQLHIQTAHYTQAPMPAIQDEVLQAIQGLVRVEGYFQGNLTQWNTPYAAVTDVISRLNNHGLLPVFAFLYDEMWMLAHQLHPVIEGLLGPNYAMLPDFWAWHVDPTKAESGWRPHRDKGFRALAPDGSPTSVTAWIPLTHATTLNGCMYIVPADRDPTYGTPQDKDWKFQYPDVRALPAQPGDFFIWNQAVLHWGSHASPRAGNTPRMSCAFEFQRTDIPAWNQPLLQPRGILSYADRVRLIGKQVKQYQHMYPLPDHLSTLADRMIGYSGH